MPRRFAQIRKSMRYLRYRLRPKLIIRDALLVIDARAVGGKTYEDPSKSFEIERDSVMNTLTIRDTRFPREYRVVFSAKHVRSDLRPLIVRRNLGSWVLRIAELARKIRAERFGDQRD